eukprot:3902924-Prymnesium_polylepis.1
MSRPRNSSASPVWPPCAYGAPPECRAPSARPPAFRIPHASVPLCPRHTANRRHSRRDGCPVRPPASST